MGIPPQDEFDLATEMAELAGVLHACENLPAVCDEVVASAVRLVPGVEQAGLSLVERKNMRTAAATGPSVQRLDALQYWCREGPSLQAVETRRPVGVISLRYEPRWPEFTRRATQRDVGSVLSVPLAVRGEAMGALLLHSRKDSAFHAGNERAARLVAAHAAVAVAAALKRGQLHTALDTRDVIGQATGILMERRRIGAQEAFALLAEASQNTNRKLREIAEHLVWSGDFSEPPSRAGIDSPGEARPPRTGTAAFPSPGAGRDAPPNREPVPERSTRRPGASGIPT